MTITSKQTSYSSQDYGFFSKTNACKKLKNNTFNILQKSVITKGVNIDNVEYYLFKMVSVLEPVDHKMEEVLLRNLFVFYLESCPESIRTGILAMLYF